MMPKIDLDALETAISAECLKDDKAEILVPWFTLSELIACAVYLREMADNDSLPARNALVKDCACYSTCLRCGIDETLGGMQFWWGEDAKT